MSYPVYHLTRLRCITQQNGLWNQLNWAIGLKVYLKWTVGSQYIPFGNNVSWVRSSVVSFFSNLIKSGQQVCKMTELSMCSIGVLHGELPLKVALSFPINKIHILFKELAYIYYDKCFLWRYLCWVLKKKQHNLGLHTFKMPTSTKHLLRLTR